MSANTNNCNCDRNCICTQLSQLDVITGTLTNQNTLMGNISNRSSSVSGSVSNRGIVNGTKNYEELDNKPSIETVTLIGDKTFAQLGLSALSADDILEIIT